MADGSLKFDTKIDTGDFDKSIAMLSKAVERFSTAVDRLSGKITNGLIRLTGMPPAINLVMVLIPQFRWLTGSLIL